MDYGNLEDPMQADKRSMTMTTAAIALSILSVCTICCIYVSFLCAILGIIFALLSKGGEMTMSRNARTACTVSITSIVLSVLLLISSFVALIMQYGSIEQFWNVYMEMVESYSMSP